MIYVREGVHTPAPGDGKSLFDARFGGAKSEPDAVALSGGTGLAKSYTTCERAEPTLYSSAGEGMCSFGIAAKRAFFTSLHYGRFVISSLFGKS
jgi:hypothetical protein